MPVILNTENIFNIYPFIRRMFRYSDPNKTFVGHILTSGKPATSTLADEFLYSSKLN
jgi:hypothetical protein